MKNLAEEVMEAEEVVETVGEAPVVWEAGEERKKVAAAEKGGEKVAAWAQA